LSKFSATGTGQKYITSNKYDSVGNLISATDKDSSGNIISISTYTYNSDGSYSVNTTDGHGFTIQTTVGSVNINTGFEQTDTQKLSSGNLISDVKIAGDLIGTNENIAIVGNGGTLNTSGANITLQSGASANIIGDSNS